VCQGRKIFSCWERKIGLDIRRKSEKEGSWESLILLPSFSKESPVFCREKGGERGEYFSQHKRKKKVANVSKKKKSEKKKERFIASEQKNEGEKFPSPCWRKGGQRREGGVSITTRLLEKTIQEEKRYILSLVHWKRKKESI